MSVQQGQSSALDACFGQVLRQLREAHALTQEGLGFDADLSRNYISLLELGQQSPSLRTLQALCSPLGVSLSQMMLQLEQEMAQRAKAVGKEAVKATGKAARR